MPLFSLGASLPTITKTDTFTSAGSGSTVDISRTPMTCFSLAVKGVGAIPTLWTVSLEGSLDGSNWTTILKHLTTTGDGQILSLGSTSFPVLYFRTTVVSLTLGTATSISTVVVGAS